MSDRMNRKTNTLLESIDGRLKRLVELAEEALGPRVEEIPADLPDPDLIEKVRILEATDWRRGRDNLWRHDAFGGAFRTETAWAKQLSRQLAPEVEADLGPHSDEVVGMLQDGDSLANRIADEVAHRAGQPFVLGESSYHRKPLVIEIAKALCYLDYADPHSHTLDAGDGNKESVEAVRVDGTTYVDEGAARALAKQTHEAQRHRDEIRQAGAEERMLREAQRVAAEKMAKALEELLDDEMSQGDTEADQRLRAQGALNVWRKGPMTLTAT